MCCGERVGSDETIGERRERKVCLGLIDAIIWKYQKRLRGLSPDSGDERLACAQKMDALYEAKAAIKR